MSKNNVKNFFAQPINSSNDNSLVIEGTMSVSGTQSISGIAEITSSGELQSKGDLTGTNGTVADFVIDATDLAEALTLANALKAIAIDIGAMASS